MGEKIAVADTPEICRIELSDLRASLVLGWRDFMRAPFYGLFFSSVYVAGGWIVFWSMTTEGQMWLTIPAAAGFPILGPFIACGYYEISRRFETGEPLDPRAVLGVIFLQKDRQIPSIAAVIVVFFLFWNFLGHMIFALFLGLQVMTNITSSFEVFLTPNGVVLVDRGQLAAADGQGVGFRDRDDHIGVAGAAQPACHADLGHVDRGAAVFGNGGWFFWAVHRVAGSGPCHLAPLSPGAGLICTRR